MSSEAQSALVYGVLLSDKEEKQLREDDELFYSLFTNKIGKPGLFGSGNACIGLSKLVFGISLGKSDEFSSSRLSNLKPTDKQVDKFIEKHEKLNLNPDTKIHYYLITWVS